jgi:putative endonuclease
MKVIFSRLRKSLLSYFDRRKEIPITPLKIGAFAETQAVAYLKKNKKLHIICRNWRNGRDELDIVGWDRNVLVFIEVRARNENAFVSGYYSVNRRKKRALARACKAYMAKLKNPPPHFRFDIVEVRLGSKQKFTLNHYQNVSLFSKYYHPKKTS